MARILVLDEHAVYRRGLCELIRAQMPQAQVLAAKSLIEALPQIRNGGFDLVLLGLDLSTSETVDTLKIVREASAATRFAITSASVTRRNILATLAAGLHGFISKHQSDTEILAAINDILSGRIYVPRSLAEADDGEASDREAAASLSTEPDLSKLTKRQREVLQLLARGMSNKQIARALKIAEATTKIHMAALLRALGARNRTEAAYKAGNLGLDYPVLVPTSGQNIETSAASDHNISLQTAPGLRKKLRRDSSVDLRKVGVQ
jgi:DNA-binding NarL/FixJ family response regulator